MRFMHGFNLRYANFAVILSIKNSDLHYIKLGIQVEFRAKKFG